MDGERRAHMNEVHIQDAPDNLPPNNVRGNTHAAVASIIKTYIRTSLVLLSFNTSYIIQI